MFKQLIASLLLFTTVAQAGLPPTTLKGQSDATAKTKFFFQTPHNQTTDLGGVNALIETGNGNILPDPGFEASVSGWTASGGATATSNSTAKGTGAKGYDWDSNSAAQTLVSTSVTIPNGYQGKNGFFSCNIKTVSGTATHTIQADDGTNPIGSAFTIPASTTTFISTYNAGQGNFVFPSSGTVRIKLISVNANEPEIYIDDCVIALASNFSNFPNAVSASEADYDWTSYTPTFTGFGTVTGVECQHSRVSSNLLLRCKFTNGTPTAVEARVSLPNSLVSADTVKIPSISVAGYGSENSVGVTPIVGATHSVLIEPSVGYVTFGFRNGSQGALTKTTGSSGFTSSTAFSFTASIPASTFQTNQRAPTLVGSVTSNSTSAIREEAALLNCGASSSIVTQYNGGWITSIGNVSAGNCIVTLPAGTFSATPACFINSNDVPPAGEQDVYTSSATSTTSVTITQRWQSSGSTTINNGNGFSATLMCRGPR